MYIYYTPNVHVCIYPAMSCLDTIQARQEWAKAAITGTRVHSDDCMAAMHIAVTRVLCTGIFRCMYVTVPLSDSCMSSQRTLLRPGALSIRTHDFRLDAPSGLQPSWAPATTNELCYIHLQPTCRMVGTSGSDGTSLLDRSTPPGVDPASQQSWWVHNQD